MSLDSKIVTPVTSLEGWLVVAFVAIAFFVIALFAYKTQKKADSTASYFAAGRGVPWQVACLSLVASWTWATTTMAAGEGAYTHGFAASWYYPIGGGIGILIVMAVLGAFWQLFVVCGMHMPVILLAQVQIIAAGYDPFVFVSTNCAMAAVWGCAFGAFLKMKNPDEKSLAIGYVISAIAGGVTEPALFGILMRFRRTMFGMFIGGAIGAVFSGLMGVTYYLAGGASNFLVFTNYLQGGQMNTVWAIVGMAISFVIAAAVVFVSGFSKEELAEMEA